MKTGLKFSFLSVVLVLSTSLISGCARHMKPAKYDIYSENIAMFQGDQPVTVIIPEAIKEEYLVEEFTPGGPAVDMYVDLNTLYNNAFVLIENELLRHKIKISPSAKKQIKFEITKIQWERWAGGFAIGAYMEFDVETGDGYKAHYRVQDGSSVDISNAIGGTVSRAVEKLFQDPEIVNYLKAG